MSDREDLPLSVWLCPGPWGHAREFYVPHGGICPAAGCRETLVEYRLASTRDAAVARAERAEAERDSFQEQVARMNAEMLRAEALLERLAGDLKVMSTGWLPDGDSVNVPTAIYAEKALAAVREHTDSKEQR